MDSQSNIRGIKNPLKDKWMMNIIKNMIMACVATLFIVVFVIIFENTLFIFFAILFVTIYSSFLLIEIREELKK